MKRPTDLATLAPSLVPSLEPPSLLKMYCLVRTWRLAAGPLSKVIDLPRRTLAAAALAAAHVRHRGGSAGASGSSALTRLGHSSHSVTKLSLACMSTCRSRPAPELTNLCATLLLSKGTLQDSAGDARTREHLHDDGHVRPRTSRHARESRERHG